MSVSSGAGAAVASGAGYQARVAAYFVACALSDLAIPFMPSTKPSKISMETSDAIDDLQIVSESGKRSCMQVKRSISFSTSPKSEMRSVLKQFVSQHLNTQVGTTNEYCLVVSSDSSKRVTGDMLAALAAARDCSTESFERDQPKSIVSTYNTLLEAVVEIQQELGAPESEETARKILSMSRVIVLDIDPDSSLEQAIVLALHSTSFPAPNELWGKLVSDCLEWARRRKTHDLAAVINSYEHLKVRSAKAAQKPDAQYLEATFSADSFEVGRELVIGRALDDQAPLKKGSVGIIEFYRFDDDCQPRLRFENNLLILQSGLEIELFGRFATWVGLNRFLDENIERFKDEEVVFIPMDIDEDLESGLCAATHRNALEAAALRRDGTKCVHCERPVSSSMSPVVEFGLGDALVLGVSHKECLRPTDRVMGVADCDLFRENPELVNFDVNGWFDAAHSGHGVFHGIEVGRQAVTPIVWGGLPTYEDTAGEYVVVSKLEDGSEELTLKRGRVQRFTKRHADEFSAKLNGAIVQAENSGDVLCYSDQSRAFGSKSTLMPLIGGKEKFLSIVNAVVRPFDGNEAARYPDPGSWYAPVLILRERATKGQIVLADAVPLISDPLALGRYLDNWHKAGFDIPSYEVEVLATDSQVDQLIDAATRLEQVVVIDPLLSEDGQIELVRGCPIHPIDLLDKSSGE